MRRSFPGSRALALVVTLVLTSAASAKPGHNINIVGPTPLPDPASPLFDADGYNLLAPDFGIKQQNEPSCAVRPDNPDHLICSYNDYRIADDPERGGDAWQGVSMSRDGGLTWVSRLAPGYRGYRAAEGFPLGYEFAADPTVVAVPGLTFLNFISKNRGSGNSGGLYLQRWWDTNRETQFPWQPDPNTIEIEAGTAGRFIDLPTMLFNPKPGAAPLVVNGVDEEGATQVRTIPGGELLTAYTVFVGNDNNNGTKINIRRSTDGGSTWSQAFKVSESEEVNQGVSLAADPNSDAVVVAWRRFSDPNDAGATPVDAMLFATSSDRGRTWSRAKVLRDLTCPFDHPSTQVTFRSNAYPVVVHDGIGFRAYWAERVAGSSGGCTNGLARIHSAELGNGNKWSAPELVDPAVAAGGHQYMPAASTANGQTRIAWIDTRNDLIVPAFQQALGSPDAALTVNLQDQPELAFLTNLLGLDPAAPVATITGKTLRDAAFIFDFRAEAAQGPVVFRHSADVRSTLRSGGGFAPSEQVSQYLAALSPENQQQAVILEHNWLNPRLFAQGQFPFNGDFIAVAAKAFRQDAAGNWQSNITDDGGEESFLVSWADNRDVRGDVWLGDPNLGNRTQYGPPNMAAAPLDDPTPDYVPACIPGDASTGALDLTRNQNVYSSMIRPAFSASNASAVKPLLTADGTVQRAYVLTLRNNDDQRFPDDPGKRYRMRIQPDLTVNARFNQFTDASTPNQLTLEVLVPPLSEAARTLFASDTTNAAAPQIPVAFFELTTDSTGQEIEIPLGTVTLNENTSAGTLEPAPGSIEDLLSVETHEPEILALFPTATGELGFRGVTSFNFDDPAFTNFDLANPTFLNPTFLNPTFLNPGFQNPTFLNPTFLNPTFLNPTFLNPTFLNPTFLNEPVGDLSTTQSGSLVNAPAAVTNGTIARAGTDVTFVFTNTGNTTTAYSLSPFVNASPAATQLIGSRLYAQPSSSGCELGFKLQNQVVFNIINPQLGSDANPDLLTAGEDPVGTLYLAPGDIFAVTLRIWGDANFNPDLVGLRAYSQACDTNQTNSDCAALRPNDGVGELDVTAPTLTPTSGPVPLSPFAANAPGGANIPPGDFGIVAADNSDPNPTLVCSSTGQQCASSDDCTLFFAVNSDGGSTPVQCSAQDFAGNSTPPGTYSVQVLDTEPPVITVPPATLVLDTTRADALLAFDSSVFDLGDPTVVVTCMPANGSVLPIGTTSVTCSSTDASGNTSTASFDVVVNDVAPPVLTPAEGPLGDVAPNTPGGATLSLEDLGLAATDNGDPSPTLACTSSGQTCTNNSSCTLFFAVNSNGGSTSLDCSAQDAAGNSTQAQYSIQVLDTVPPAITVPTATIILDTSGTDALLTYASSVTDLGDPTVILSCTPASGSVLAIGSTSVSCSATDASGNTSSAGFEVVVQDVGPPVLTPTAGPLGSFAPNVPGGADLSLGDLGISIADNSDPNPSLTCTSNGQECGNIGSCSLFFAVNTNNSITPLQCSAQDAAGNMSQVSYSLQVLDTIAPSITAPVGTISLDTNSADATLIYASSVTDLGDPTVTLSCTPASGSVLPIGTAQVLCTATDASLNTSTASFTVVVRDTAPPVLALPADQELQQLTNTGVAYSFAVAVSDNSGAATVACGTDNGTTLVEGTNLQFSGVFTGTTVVTCTAADAAGNLATGSFKVAVRYADFIGLFTSSGQLAEGAMQTRPVSGGSALPVTWQYARNGQIINSSSAVVGVEQSAVDCASGEISASFPGSSDLRYKASANTWQFNWVAPVLPGCHALFFRANGQVNGPFLFRTR